MPRPIEKALNEGLYNPDLRSYTVGDFDGSHAAPLLIAGSASSRRLIAKQDRLAWKMADAAYGETIKIAKPSVAMFVARSVVSRMSQREGMNGMSYDHRRHRFPRTDLVPNASKLEVINACRLAKPGRGSMLQNDMARRAWGMASTELANITIFNNFRRDEEAPVWEGASNLVGRDATPRSSEMYGLRVLGLDRPLSDHQHLGAVRISMKRRLGELDDGTIVKARTTAIINVSPSSGFDQDIIETFRGFKDAEDAEDEEDEYLLEQIASLPQFQRAVEWLIDAGMPEGLVLARNETVYEDASMVAYPPNRWQAYIRRLTAESRR